MSFEIKKVAAAVAAVVVGYFAAPAMANDWPEKPVKLVVPFAPGGGADITARLIAERLNEKLKQPVVVENKPGAGGMLASEYVAKSKGDGYTLLLGTIGPLAINPSLHAKMPYDPAKDFAPITLVGNALNVLVINTKLPVKSVAEFISYAQNNSVTFGSSGSGATDHLAGELFASMAKAKMVHVPYKGGTPAMMDLIGGHVDAIFSTVSTAHGAIKEGKVVPLGMTGIKRFVGLPNVPTIDEAGLKGFEVNNWYGIVAPVATPAAVVNKLNQAIVESLAEEGVKKKLLDVGIEAQSNTAEEFKRYIEAETAKWKSVVQQTGISAN